MNWHSRADHLLEEFNLCMQARPKHNAVDVQLEKDRCATFAYNLATQRGWGTDVEIAEACHQLEPRLKQLKEKLIFEVLKHGTI
jgi:hypothetical protein